MRIITVFFVLSMVFLGCREKEDNAALEVAPQNVLFTFQGMPKLVPLRGKAKEIASNWKPYLEYKQSLDLMFNATTNEDLKLAIDDLLENEAMIREESFPEAYDHMKIKSRLKVERTFLLKIKAGLENNKDVVEGMKQLLQSHNALQRQLNLMVNNPIDLDSIIP